MIVRILLPLLLGVANSLPAQGAGLFTLDRGPASLGGGIRGGLSAEEILHPPAVPGAIDLTHKTANLWDRVRAGFAMPDLNDPLVLQHQQWYQSRPEALRRMVERSRPYLFHIVEALERRGMPTELALLPMVESSFNPMAYSPAHAAGLWQFIPATGKRFDLEQSWWRDERRDVIASTEAAINYLHTIYEMQGDWHLALASYNWGEGAVRRAVEKNEAAGLPTDYPALNMPNETRHYVPKLQALKNIFSNPLLLVQLGVPDIANEPYFVTLETRQPIDVNIAARLANLSEEEFRRLNPAHNRPVITSESIVVLPKANAEAFRNNMNQASEPLTRWRAYTLKAGEKLEAIARRFGMSFGELMSVNGLGGKATAGPGTTVLVPAESNEPRNLDDIEQLNMPPLLSSRSTAKPAPKARLSGNSKAPRPPVLRTPKPVATPRGKKR